MATGHPLWHTFTCMSLPNVYLPVFMADVKQLMS